MVFVYIYLVILSKSDYIKNKSIFLIQNQAAFIFRFIHKKTTGKKVLITNNYLKMPDEHKPLSNFTFFIIQKLFKYFIILHKKKMMYEKF